MPRPYNWIRGEGTVKNQRGMGDSSLPPMGPPPLDPLGVDAIPSGSTYADLLASAGINAQGGASTMNVLANSTNNSYMPLMLAGGVLVLILALRR